MADIHAELSVDLPWHKKVRGLPLADAPAAFGLYSASVCFCQKGRTDGIVFKGQLPALMPIKESQLKRLTKLLCDAQLWDEHGDHITVHDYLDWNKSRAEIEALIDSRRRSGSKGGRRSAANRQASATASAQADAQGSAKDLLEAKSNPIAVAVAAASTEEQRAARAGALPTCLSTKFPKTRWTGPDDSKHDTAAQAFWATVESIKGGLVSPADFGTFSSIVSSTCPATCPGDEDSVDACLTVLCKAAEKTKGKPSPLFRKICEEDR